MASRSNRQVDPGKKRCRFARLFPACVALVLSACIFAGVFLYFLDRDLPSISVLRDYRPSIVTRVYADNNELIDQFYLEDRRVINIQELPPHVIQAFISAEDSRFFSHRGLDFQGIVRAFFKNLQALRIVQGGSTITQQVAKTLFLTPEKSYMRKVREALLALKIERYLKKHEILNLYLNQIYLGHGTYGIEAASERYFGKEAKNLSLAEAALLAGLPKAPSTYSPLFRLERARQRQAYVLSRMVDEGYITANERTEAFEEPLAFKKPGDVEKIAPHFTELVRRYIQERYSSRVLYKEGLEVYTTLNVSMQKAARDAVDRGLRELDHRQGYRGAPENIPPERFEAFLEALWIDLGRSIPETGRIVSALVTGIDREEKMARLRIGPLEAVMAMKDMAWATGNKDPDAILRAGDVVEARVLDARAGEPLSPLLLELEQEPEVQGALMCIESRTGAIKAMVGGRNFEESEFNRATQAVRQPGSSFKPLIYAAAFDRGMTPSTIVMDTPIVYRDTLQDSAWKPRNYEETFHGPTTLRTALIRSRNLVTIKILKDMGIEYALDYIRNMGITSPLARDLSLALGSSGITLLETVRAFSVFANNGDQAEPFFIRMIVDRSGTVIEENKPSLKRAIDPRIAFITSHLLQGVVQSGTGWRVKALGRPVAGKTGTTNDLRDAWFIGYTPSLVAAVWVGFDDFRPLGRLETGSRAASPIFLYFMEKALESKPVETFTSPEGVVFVRIDPETGRPAPAGSKTSVFESYLEGTEPTESMAVEKSFSPGHRDAAGSDLGTFLKRDRESWEE
ncbi:MAG: PBP1A family penicillin-binding protein [Syntrophales bacterium]|nr:PBP1A family penicillin-binding protein [Syntrophales bacterium]MCK9527905.1 PBP1A family penicillin-binding protein [Syntrophales bacterium]MDX9921919.1 PBP1A family penicillin-binding protein [Syntrophales bacterium]